MERFFVAFTALAMLAAIVAKNVGAEPGSDDRFETRCGWFDNPTPGNLSLYDRDREWIIGVQGGHQIESDWEWPKFSPNRWVHSNGNHGYGCACMDVKTDGQRGRITAIQNARARPLAACRRDQALKKWERIFK